MLHVATRVLHELRSKVFLGQATIPQLVEIHRVLWDPKYLSRFQKVQPLVPIVCTRYVSLQDAVCFWYYCGLQLNAAVCSDRRCSCIRLRGVASQRSFSLMTVSWDVFSRRFEGTCPDLQEFKVIICIATSLKAETPRYRLCEWFHDSATVFV